jgi:hypothetical protein
VSGLRKGKNELENEREKNTERNKEKRQKSDMCGLGRPFRCEWKDEKNPFTAAGQVDAWRNFTKCDGEMKGRKLKTEREQTTSTKTPIIDEKKCLMN